MEVEQHHVARPEAEPFVHSARLVRCAQQHTGLTPDAAPVPEYGLHEPCRHALSPPCLVDKHTPHGADLRFGGVRDGPMPKLTRCRANHISCRRRDGHEGLVLQRLARLSDV
eukprot:746592-Prymnesium_polylepis.1